MSHDETKRNHYVYSLECVSSTWPLVIHKEEKICIHVQWFVDVVARTRIMPN